MVQHDEFVCATSVRGSMSPRSWRLDGIAYEFGDQIYDQPNRTMISYAEGMMMKGQQRGMKKEIRLVRLRLPSGGRDTMALLDDADSVSSRPCVV